LLKQLIEL